MKYGILFFVYEKTYYNDSLFSKRDTIGNTIPPNAIYGF